MTISQRFWRVITLLVRVDMAAAVAVTAGLLFWVTWH